MAKSGHAMAIVGVAVAVVPLATSLAWSDSQWDVAYNQEVRYFSWRGDRGFPAPFTAARGGGTQVYFPTTVIVTGTAPDSLKFQLVTRGGFVSSRQTSPGLTGSVTTPTDTVTAATLTLLSIPGIQPFVALNANLPTGRSVLSGSASFARMDPDLVDIATFGEGWNIGPTVGANVALTPDVILAGGWGYTDRGRYNRENIVLPAGGVGQTTVDPGNTQTVNASLGFRHGPLRVQIAGSHVREGATTFAGVPSVQLGNRSFVSGNGSFAWNDSSVTSVAASWSHTQKNKALVPPFLTEAFNSNSNVYRVRLEHAFNAPGWSFGPTGSYLLRDENAYSSTTLQFVPAKTVWSAGGNLRHKPHDSVLLYANVERLWVTERARPAAVPNPVPASHYTAWMAAAGVTLAF
ncbi:MAG: hypothetical protein K2Y71_20410 [Xanthobacteraceae bacterium]|nr:hypothetical protein [Xanthobacteraceae bacterium]